MAVVQENAEQRGVQYAFREPELVPVKPEPLVCFTGAREMRSVERRRLTAGHGGRRRSDALVRGRCGDKKSPLLRPAGSRLGPTCPTPPGRVRPDFVVPWAPCEQPAQ